MPAANGRTVLVCSHQTWLTLRRAQWRPSPGIAQVALGRGMVGNSDLWGRGSDSAVGKFDGAISQVEQLVAVGDEDDGASLPVLFDEEVCECLRVAPVEVSGRLIGQDELRFGGNRPGGRNSLLFNSRRSSRSTKSAPPKGRPVRLWSRRSRNSSSRIGPDFYPVLPAPLGHQIQVGHIVVVAEKRLLSAVSTLRDVVRQAWDHQSC